MNDQDNLSNTILTHWNTFHPKMVAQFRQENRLEAELEATAQNAAMALDVASRAYVLAAGSISVEGTPEQLKASPIVEQLYFGAVPEGPAHA